MKVQLGKKIITLLPGQSITAEKNIVHRFFSTSGEVCKFRVTLNPASRGFEESLQIGYGLADDGKCNAKEMPKNPLVLAWRSASAKAISPAAPPFSNPF